MLPILSALFLINTFRCHHIRKRSKYNVYYTYLVTEFGTTNIRTSSRANTEY